MAFTYLGTLPRQYTPAMDIGAGLTGAMNAYNAQTALQDSPEYQIAQERLKNARMTNEAIAGFQATNPDLMNATLAGVPLAATGNLDIANKMQQFNEMSTMNEQQRNVQKLQLSAQEQLIPAELKGKLVQAGFIGPTAELTYKQLYNTVQQQPELFRATIGRLDAESQHYVASALVQPELAAAKTLEAKAAMSRAGAEWKMASVHNRSLDIQERALGLKEENSLFGMDSKLSQQVQTIRKNLDDQLRNPMYNKPADQTSLKSQAIGSLLDAGVSQYVRIKAMASDKAKANVVPEALKANSIYFSNLGGDIVDLAKVAAAKKDPNAMATAQTRLKDLTSFLDSTGNQSFMDLSSTIKSGFDSAVNDVITSTYGQPKWYDFEVGPQTGSPEAKELESMTGRPVTSPPWSGIWGREARINAARQLLKVGSPTQ